MEKDILIEERGVASNYYNNQINDIYNFLVKYLSEHKPFKENCTIQIQIPKELTNKIDFIDENNFAIDVNVKIHKIEDSIWGSAMTKQYVNDYINNYGELNNGKIIINAYANTEGFIYKRTFFNNIYHELNHLYDSYSQLAKNKNKIDISQTKYGSIDVAKKINNIDIEIKNNIKDYYDVNTCSYISSFIKEILYRLFSDTELNSIVSSVYGDLKSIHSERKNANSDIKKTSGYYIYENLNKFINDFQHINSESCNAIYQIFNSRNIKIGNSCENFKINFYKIVKNKLKYLYKKIIKASSLWYDNFEDSKDIIDEYIKKSCGTILVENEIIHIDKEIHFNKHSEQELKRINIFNKE